MGQIVRFGANGSTAEAYLATPSAGSGPGVIVLQEWWGLVDHIKQVCDRFAEAGFTALAPDLYHGETTTSPDDAGRLMMALNIDEADRDLAGAVEYLLGQAAGDKVGVVGFCMGGQLALYSATKSESVAACVDFYGIHPKVQPDLSKLSGPVLGFFGEHDDFVKPDDARTLEKAIRDAGGQAEFHVYSDAGHAFFNDSRPEAYREGPAKEAWEKMLGFFRSNLS